MRLTNDMKSDIVAAAVEKSGLNKKRAALNTRLSRWAERVRLSSIGGKAKEKALLQFEEEINAKREKFGGFIRLDAIVRRSRLCYRIAGKTVHVTFYADKTIDPLTRGYHAEREHRISHGEIEIDDPLHAQCVLFNELYAQRDDLDREFSQLKAEVFGALENMTTVKKLLDAWPEAKALLPKTVPKTVTALALPTAELNRKVGLP